jgi:hypothetical protein
MLNSEISCDVYISNIYMLMRIVLRFEHVFVFSVDPERYKGTEDNVAEISPFGNTGSVLG